MFARSVAIRPSPALVSFLGHPSAASACAAATARSSTVHVPAVVMPMRALQQDSKDIGVFRREKDLWQELADYQQHSGKFFEAVDHIVPEELCRSFPSFECQNLVGNRKDTSEMRHERATLYLVHFNVHGKQSLTEWKKAFTEVVSPEDPAGYVEISIIENSLYSLFRGIIHSTLRAQVPYSRHLHYYTYIGNNPDLRASANMFNRFVGHMFLVDGKGLVRWQAHGRPRGRELTSFQEVVHQMVHSHPQRFK